MNRNQIGKFRPFTLVCGVALLLAVTPLVFGQVSSKQSSRDPSLNMRSVPSGAKMKFRGVVMGRDADTFTIRDRTRTD